MEEWLLTLTSLLLDSGEEEIRPAVGTSHGRATLEPFRGGHSSSFLPCIMYVRLHRSVVLGNSTSSIASKQKGRNIKVHFCSPIRCAGPISMVTPGYQAGSGRFLQWDWKESSCLPVLSFLFAFDPLHREAVPLSSLEFKGLLCQSGELGNHGFEGGTCLWTVMSGFCSGNTWNFNELLCGCMLQPETQTPQGGSL